MRPALLIAVALGLAACGGKTDAPAADAAAEAVKVDPKEAKEEADAKELKTKLDAQKPEFDAALAASDLEKLDDLADAGNGWALLHRAQQRLSSQDFSMQQGGFEDMEAAASNGVAEAQFWVGLKMAYGQDGYQLKPNSGLMMMKRAARQGNEEAILAVGLMYEQDTFMRDLKQAREWYERGVANGSAKAKEALAKLGTQSDIGEPPT